jgi:putative restriction endonuclease
VERDESVRAACFAALDVLRAEFGDDLPYLGGLDRGFGYRGARVPFLNYQKGIYRARVQRGPAALSIQTSSKSPYGDEETDLGFLYAYRSGSIDQPDNRALRAARDAGAPIAYFVGIRAGVYRALYPFYVVEDRPHERCVLVAPGVMTGPMDDPEPAPLASPIEREYRVREVRVRLHQARFRSLVLPAYRERCAVCRLRELQLLDAAHIIEDSDPRGLPQISNGLSLCSIHHRAFDQHLVGISPDYQVRVARRLLEDADGPMLEVLKTFDGSKIVLPARSVSRPSRELLSARFERFLETV